MKLARVFQIVGGIGEAIEIGADRDMICASHFDEMIQGPGDKIQSSFRFVRHKPIIHKNDRSNAAGFSNFSDLPILQIIGAGIDFKRADMRGNDGESIIYDVINLFSRRWGAMGDIDDHSQFHHFLDDLLAEIGQPEC